MDSYPARGVTMNKVDKYIDALEKLGDGRFHYYDGRTDGIGCSEYTRQALIEAGIIKTGENFHAASGFAGVLTDTTRFQRIPWSPANLHRGDIMWSSGYHVATWDGKNGVYEASPESTHGICDNGRTGVGHWSNHTYRNCGNGTYTWTCLYRIIEIQKVKEELKFIMDKAYNVKMLIEYLPVIQAGSKGNIVKGLQTILKKYGWYADEIDGHAGPKTVNGIKFLQTAVGAYADGICGPKTWGALLS